MTASATDTAPAAARRGGWAGDAALRAVSVVVLFLLWELAADLLRMRALPAATSVLATLVDDLVRGDLLHHLLITLWRVAASFVLALSLGTAVGLAMGRWRLVDVLFDSWVVILLNLPALVIAVLAYVWFGLTEAAAIGAVALNKLPLVAMTMREGARSLERDYSEVAAVYRMGMWRRFRHVLLPQLAPFLLVAARSGLSLVWKIVLVVELLGRSDGIGFEIQVAFQLFDVAQILAAAIAFIAVIQLVEWGILQPIERRVGAWRR